MIFQLLLPGTGGQIDIPEPSGFKFAGQAEGTIGHVISEALIYLFPLTGLILFFTLITAGFSLMTSASNPEATAKAYKKILFALVGFLIIFLAYWLIQILEFVLGIKVF